MQIETLKVFSMMFLLTISLNIFANDSLTFKAEIESKYILTSKGFMSSEIVSPSWSIIKEHSRYFLLIDDTKFELELIKSDKYVIILRQNVTFSGFRIYTFFRKSNVFSISKSGYSYFPEISVKERGIAENIMISHGSYTIE